MTMKMTHENVARALLNASLDNFMDSDGKCKCCVDPTVAQKAFEMLNPVRPKVLDYDAWGHKYFCGNCNYEIVCNTSGCPIYKADNTYFFSPYAAAAAWNTRLFSEPLKEEKQELKSQREDEATSDMRDYFELYEPTYNPEDGSM